MIQMTGINISLIQTPTHRTQFIQKDELYTGKGGIKLSLDLRFKYQYSYFIKKNNFPQQRVKGILCGKKWK